jgi:hypothetical protein
MKNKLKSVRRGSKSAASPQSKTQHGNALDRPARKTRPDCNTIGILSQGYDGRLERDLAGRLFIVVPRNRDYTDLERRELSYDDAVTFVAKHTLWKDPRKFLALHGINAPSPGLKGAGCLCMYQAGQMAGEIPLVEHELPQATIAAVRAGLTVDQFIAQAIREKLGTREQLGAEPQAQTLERSQEKRRHDIYDRWGLLANKALAIIEDLRAACWKATDKQDALQKYIADGREGLAFAVMDELLEHKEVSEAAHRSECEAHRASEQRRAA